MGILSHGLIGVLQAGHDEDGFIIEMFLGNLYIQTLRNEPTMRPNKKNNYYHHIGIFPALSFNSAATIYLMLFPLHSAKAECILNKRYFRYFILSIISSGDGRYFFSSRGSFSVNL